ncbi:MAG: HEPN domain-containing protein [Thaumarchaeota archaeon]|nr:HEPN domain-containing protein [Nitrososphaerota archaeon]
MGESLLIVLPKRIEEKLREESERIGVSEEELVLEALSKILNEPIDPESRVELHLKLSEKYLRDAEDFLAKGDYVQASEKAWGAASQMVKALAARRGKEIRSHGELHKYVAELSGEKEDREIITLWFSASSLHQNFYENWLPEEAVRSGVENVKSFLEKLKKLL